MGFRFAITLNFGFTTISTCGGISKIVTKTLGVRDDEGVSYTIWWLGRIGGSSTSTSIEVEAKTRWNLKLGVGHKGAIAKKIKW